MKNSIIRSILLLASVLIVSVCIFYKSANPASAEASSKIRKALEEAEASMVTVHEGLPHQMFESDLLDAESKRKDTEKIGSFRFYTPAVAATSPDVLKHLLSSSDSIQVFVGEKKCGGFHPDYTV